MLKWTTVYLLCLSVKHPVNLFRPFDTSMEHLDLLVLFHSLFWCCCEGENNGFMLGSFP